MYLISLIKLQKKLVEVDGNASSVHFLTYSKIISFHQYKIVHVFNTTQCGSYYYHK